MVNPSPEPSDLTGIRILMLAPCLGKFGGIETFCLTLIEDLVMRGAKVRLLRKRVNGFSSDGSIERSEEEIEKTWPDEHRQRFSSEYVDRGDRIIRSAIEESDLIHLHNPMQQQLLTNPKKASLYGLGF